MTFETIDESNAPQPPQPPAESGGRDRNHIDSALRLAIQEVGQASSTAQARNRRERESREIPRESKIGVGIASAIIATLIMIPIVAWLTEIPPEPVAPPPAPAPAPVATLPADSSAKPRSNASTPSGGAAIAATPPPPTGEHVEAPMPAGALTVLRGLHGLIHQASHLPPGSVPGNIDPEADFLPDGTLEGSPAEVLENLQQVQLRVARTPALALRVLSEQHSHAAYKFDLEVVAATPGGEEMISRSTLVLVPVSAEVMRITRLDRFEAFEKTGLAVGPATFEQAKETHEGGAVVASYPYIIH